MVATGATAAGEAAVDTATGIDREGAFLQS